MLLYDHFVGIVLNFVFDLFLQMVDFLLQDGVCESLLSFITLNAPDSVRPAPSDTHSAALKKSYR